jgi:hypothetical protein
MSVIYLKERQNNAVGCGFETDCAKRPEARTILLVSDLSIVRITSSQEQAGFLLQNSQFKICPLMYSNSDIAVRSTHGPVFGSHASLSGVPGFKSQLEDRSRIFSGFPQPFQ